MSAWERGEEMQPGLYFVHAEWFSAPDMFYGIVVVENLTPERKAYLGGLPLGRVSNERADALFIARTGAPVMPGHLIPLVANLSPRKKE